MINSSEAIGGARVRILVRKKARSKFKRKTLEVGDMVYIKSAPGEAWEGRSVLILVTEDGKEDSESFGFHPEELERVKPDSE